MELITLYYLKDNINILFFNNNIINSLDNYYNINNKYYKSG